MDTNKVIVTLLVLTIVLSVATVAFGTVSSNKTAVVPGQEGKSIATVGIYVAGGQPVTENANVGLYVENVTP